MKHFINKIKILRSAKTKNENKISFGGVITDTPVKITDDTRKTIALVMEFADKFEKFIRKIVR